MNERTTPREDGELTGTSVGIVGGGFGGLSAAAHLAEAGADVTLYERRSEVGGVASRLERDGFRFDTGPSWYLMPETFERFFERFGRRPEDYYELVRLDPNYRVFWDDGDRADVPADPAAAAELFESYEPGAGEAFRRYLDDAEDAYEIGMGRFVVPGRSRVRDYLASDVVRSGRGLTLLGTLDDHAKKYVEHPKLRQLLEYTLVFLGGSPYNTPALYKLMSHVDFGLGVYYPQGGMYKVVEALAAVAREQGATIRTGTTVTGIEPGGDRVAVDTRPTEADEDRDGGERIVHDRVVCAVPPEYAERELLPAGATRRLHDRLPGTGDYWEGRTYGPSAYMCYLGVEGDVEPLEHHTLVLPTDWDPHFESIFKDPRWPDSPAFYVNVPSQTDPTVAPDGHETVVVLVPLAPGLDDTPERREAFRGKILDALHEHAGVDLRGRIVVEETACISEFASWFNKPHGSALGLAHTLTQTGPLRPGQRAPGLDRVYYAGGSANPGIGMPMCLLSGEHVADAIREDVGGGGVIERALPGR